MTTNSRFACAVLVAGLLAGCADAGFQPPPPPAPKPAPMQSAWQQFARTTLSIESNPDVARRCWAYPDMPEQKWMTGSALTRCALVEPSEIALADVAASFATQYHREQLRLLLEELVRRAAARHDEAALHLFYAQFDGGDEAAGIARRWLEAQPESPYARTAFAIQRGQEALRARGRAPAADTSPEAMQAMHAGIAEAAPHLRAVMQEVPGMIPACVWAMQLGRFASDRDLVREGLEACNEVAPDSYWVVREMMSLADPRWGGSPEAMQQVVQYIREHQAGNQILGSLVALPEYSMLRDSPPTGTDADLGPARALAAAAPHPDSLGWAGERIAMAAPPGPDGAELRWEGISLLSQALRFAPSNVDFRHARGMALLALEEAAHAERDLDIVAAAKPLDFYVQAAWRRAHDAAASGPPASEASTMDWIGEREACAASIAARNADAEACSKHLVESAAEDPFAWWLRADALAGADRAAERAALETYLTLAKEDEPAHRTLIPKARERLVE